MRLLENMQDNSQDTEPMDSRGLTPKQVANFKGCHNLQIGELRGNLTIHLGADKSTLSDVFSIMDNVPCDLSSEERSLLEKILKRMASPGQTS